MPTTLPSSISEIEMVAVWLLVVSARLRVLPNEVTIELITGGALSIFRIMVETADVLASSVAVAITVKMFVFKPGAEKFNCHAPSLFATMLLNVCKLDPSEMVRAMELPGLAVPVMGAILLLVYLADVNTGAGNAFGSINKFCKAAGEMFPAASARVTPTL